ncbi:Cation transporter family protein [Dictyocaulus viviparus]|uniref:Cation transporter family protein n=1 Tax=Dictyocaulus viviparus TaxID=29172 RepID=A0A0D8Y805_DICVI|nr:Cation transporter family protein [Dictyocaulus viviparus]
MLTFGAHSLGIGSILALTWTLSCIILSAYGKRKLKEQEIIQRILNNYDWRVRPRGLNASWPGGNFFTQFTFREEWVDARLAYERFEDDSTEVPPFVVLATSENVDQSQQIWMPDTFFQNEKEARRHLIDKPNVLIRIHKDGSVLYSVRLSLVLSCPMSLEFYPLDRQNCLIDLASYAYTTQDIKYEWKATNPVQQKDGLRQSLPSFELQDVVTKYCTSKTNTGANISDVSHFCPRAKKQPLLTLYALPMESTNRFFLLSLPYRHAMLMFRRIFMSTYTNGATSRVQLLFVAAIYPLFYACHSVMGILLARQRFRTGTSNIRCHYSTNNDYTGKRLFAIDVWIGVCLAFIFGALLEFALVNYAARKDMSSCNQRMMKQLPHDGYRPLSGSSHSSASFCCRIFVRRYKERSKRIDVVSRLVIPMNVDLIMCQKLSVCPEINVCMFRCSLLDTRVSMVCWRLIVSCKPFVCEYSCARVKLLLRREYSYYLIQLYIPCIMLVVVSWVSFWLDKDAVPARVSLGVTTLLTMTTQASGINSKLPPVSYIKAVDVWIGVCLAFIFGALLEYAVVNYYGRKEFLRKVSLNFYMEKKKKTRLDDCVCPSERPALRLDLSNYRKSRWISINRLLDVLGRNADISRRVDLLSRITFPSFFTAFLGMLYDF